MEIIEFLEQQLLCAVDPVVFEPLDYHDLHGDIEYYYIINCKGESHIGAKPIWEVEAYGVDFDFDGKKKDKDRLSLLLRDKIDTFDTALIVDN